MGRKVRLGLVAALTGAFVLSTAGPAGFASAQTLAEKTDKIGLKGRRGPKLLRPGFEVGEYTGSIAARASARQLFGTKDRAKVDFDMTAPSLAAPVTGECSGGQSELVIAWVTWDREELSYVCKFGGGAPADASLAMALSRGSLLGRLQQPQRAGEIRWKGQTIRFETKRLGGLPFGGGRVMGYSFTKDGQEIGGLDINGLQPTFYLPKGTGPEREAVMVAALSLFAFPDPGDR